ncbi:hypothetical protein CKAN_00250000 [Cinnamomum micranthum f. kanehirae]|uniref:Uncharacterized protein n=1 Tax=Cinnamomum micranthum f. kanehirae TaxID=337451 RepID=A0A443N6L7_9MAGN|nr:hypothetical protein CKAN_00250000 [Cinnamomum micranthum f. kanehirae]
MLLQTIFFDDSELFVIFQRFGTVRSVEIKTTVGEGTQALKWQLYQKSQTPSSVLALSISIASSKFNKTSPNPHQRSGDNTNQTNLTTLTPTASAR